MTQIVNNPIMLLVLRYILPYSIAIFIFFTLVDAGEQAYQKGNTDRAWKKWVRYGIFVGIVGMIIYWTVQQPFWYKHIVSNWHRVGAFLGRVGIIASFQAQYHQMLAYVVGIWNRWSIYYIHAFVVIAFLFGIAEIFALKWQLTLTRTLNVLIPVIVQFPYLLLRMIAGDQSPVADAILSRKLKAKFRENLNDSFERAVQGYQDNGKKFEDGAGGTAATQTKKQTAVAMKRVKVVVNTTADQIRTAHIVVHQSRETETDRSIENALKGLGERISGNSIFFPRDPSYSQKEKGYVFDSVVGYNAGQNLGSFRSIFTNPFSDANKRANSGPGYGGAIKGIWINSWEYIGHFSPMAIFMRFKDIADVAFYRDLSAENAKYKIQHNLDLSVIPEPKTKDGLTIEEARDLAMKHARSRINDVTAALSSVKLSGQFKDVVVGGSTAVYEFTLPPDPQLPNDFDKVATNIGNILHIKQTPTVTLSAGILSVSIDNTGKGSTTIPVSFADMIRRRRMGASTPLAGISGLDAMGNPIYFELNMGDMPHAMLFGATGAGKTVTIWDIIYSMMDASSPDELKFSYVDGKGNSFKIMGRDSSHPNPYTLFEPGDANKDIRYSRAVLRYLEELVRDRIALFAKYEVAKLSEYNKLAKKQGLKVLPEILLVFDEFSAVLDRDSELKPGQKRVIDTMQYLAKMARSTGLHILAANQTARKQAVPGIFTANIPGRLSLKVAEPIEAEIALPMTGLRPDRINTAGEHYSLMNGGSANPEHGNSPYLPQEVMNKLNDALTKKFGLPEYLASRDDIMKYADPTDEKEEEAASLVDDEIPNPEPTPATSLSELKTMMPKYNHYLYIHREDLIANNADILDGGPAVRLKNKKIADNIIAELEDWKRQTDQANSANTHRSTGNSVATKVNKVTVGRDEDPL
ncbi:cell division protein FtsK [Limosilactobacillus reuteri]|uniref:FtsK/SpoIIIE domain-containing protein n=1 Tax=Limosilactobacillus reuteri TaxID=1598 RepID=UPI001E54609A|nr:FtsK/SpoIIIE domain-containing protein [Limosilactobacillus reuteri]MCC4370533.1 cell division protein FtsK [Limosilactobacillus reuteri]MCC4509412.1 cell division protein FtsK [Limosilactobacillus reuteri]